MACITGLNGLLDIKKELNSSKTALVEGHTSIPAFKFPWVTIRGTSTVHLQPHAYDTAQLQAGGGAENAQKKLLLLQ